MERVTIKSYPNGLSLFLDKEGTLDEILLEIGNKFQKSSDFFKNATLVLSIDGRELSIEEERLVIAAIENNSKITICSIAGKDNEKEIQFEHKMQTLKNTFTFNRVEIKEDKIIWGSVIKGEDIETDARVIILGNIEKGASVVSEKDILVLGTIYGEAHAGLDKKSNYFLYASSIDTERINVAKESIFLDKKLQASKERTTHYICKSRRDYN